MCGISGLWNFDGAAVSPAVLENMNSLLAHRGPDSNGVYREGALGPGHTRLAILDTGDGGHQPMSYGDGRWWLTYNGEIYNFLELREELAALDHRFESECDSEVLLAAYAEWGPACQTRFNGMWAFAIWDAKEKMLFLSRDRFGVKPLFWHFDGRRFAFASEMKAFLALPGFDAGFDGSRRRHRDLARHPFRRHIPRAAEWGQALGAGPFPHRAVGPSAQTPALVAHA